MTSLLFANPGWLIPFTAGIGLSGIALVSSFYYARRRSRILLGAAEAAGKLKPLPDAALFAALLLLAVALLGPRIGHRTVSVSTAGVDAMVLLDVSRSMRAADVPPSRLDRARRIAEGLLVRLEPGDRAGLSAYAGRGVILTPLSPDAAALSALLPAIDSDLITPGGSNLRDGVERALEGFDSASERSRLLVVLSDGEASGRSGDAGVASAVRANVRVVSVALGSEIGTTIPNGGAPLLDRAQRVVVSHRRRAPLQKLANATGGRLFVADEWGAIDLDDLTREVRRIVNPVSAEAGGWVEERRIVPVVIPFAALAFALLWLECARLPRGLRQRGTSTISRAGLAPIRRTATRDKLAVAVCFLLPLLLTGAATRTEPEAAADAAAWETIARARALDDWELLHLGVARAEARRNADALHAFRAVATGASDAALAAVAYHDLGVLALERDDLAGARDAFREALALAPGDSQTRFNLEWTLRALATQPPPRAPEPPDPEEPDEPDEPPRKSDSGQSDARKSHPDKSDSKDRSDSKNGADEAVGKEAPKYERTAETPADQAPHTPDEAQEEAPANRSTQRAVASAPPMDGDQREKWLQRVQDDPSRALRSAASDGQVSRRSSAPTW